MCRHGAGRTLDTCDGNGAKPTFLGLLAVGWLTAPTLRPKGPGGSSPHPRIEGDLATELRAREDHEIRLGSRGVQIVVVEELGGGTYTFGFALRPGPGGLLARPHGARGSR